MGPLGKANLGLSPVYYWCTMASKINNKSPMFTVCIFHNVPLFTEAFPSHGQALPIKVEHVNLVSRRHIYI
jgi:hypothetical protein